LKITEDKVLKRLNRIKREKARELLENPDIDIRMYSYVLDQIFEEERIRKGGSLYEDEEEEGESWYSGLFSGM